MGKSVSLKPILVLGEPFREGEFRLPESSVSPRAMYSPRGVFYDGKTLVVADTGNHRVLIWFSLPERDFTPADVVIGQKDFYSDSPNAGGNPEIGLNMPCGVWIWKGKLIVADAWNHRILIWNEIPKENGKRADIIVGQESFKDTEPKKGFSAKGFFWCYGVCMHRDYLLVCDTGNRRVVGWKGVPEVWREPEIILGNNYPFQWCHQISSNGYSVFIADAGLHRVIGYRDFPEDRIPDVVLGQESFTEVSENLFIQSEKTLRFPYGVSHNERFLAVADTGNHRVLVWRDVPKEGCGIPASDVLGQKNFTDNGENRWEGIRRDTLCWCYGVHVYENLIFVADSGNNRVVVWKVEGEKIFRKGEVERCA